ncbi:hypothetical protein BRADO6946 [Bradyrhizobium sp. ORS 278]|nr:hypothetical protein BRADO6946 [Bradyrhizobium sp. ORS 278]
MSDSPQLSIALPIRMAHVRNTSHAIGRARTKGVLHESAIITFARTSHGSKRRDER